MAQSLTKNVIYTKSSFYGATSGGDKQLVELGFNKSNNILHQNNNDRVLVTQRVESTNAVYSVRYAQVGNLIQSQASMAGDAWAKILDDSCSTKTWGLYNYSSSQAIGNAGGNVTLSSGKETATRRSIFLKFNKTSAEDVTHMYFFYYPTAHGSKYYSFLAEETITVYQVASMPGSYAEALAMTGTSLGTIGPLRNTPLGLGFQEFEINTLSQDNSYYLMLRKTNHDSKPSFYSTTATDLIYPAYIMFASSAYSCGPMFRWDFDTSEWEVS